MRVRGDRGKMRSEEIGGQGRQVCQGRQGGQGRQGFRVYVWLLGFKKV